MKKTTFICALMAVAMLFATSCKKETQKDCFIKWGVSELDMAKDYNYARINQVYDSVFMNAGYTAVNGAIKVTKTQDEVKTIANDLTAKAHALLTGNFNPSYNGGTIAKCVMEVECFDADNKTFHSITKTYTPSL